MGQHEISMMDSFANDPRVEGLLFMSSLKPLLSILVCYAALAYYGPQWMAKRNAFNMRYVVLTYDLTVAFLHLYLFCGILKAVIRLQYNWICEPVHYNAVSDDEMAIVTYAHSYFLCKLVELLDTVFYILRKKEDQLIAVHYFHHLAMIFLGYFGARWTPGGSLFFIPLLNSFIHFTVYINHSLTLIQSKFNPSSWWRKYVLYSMIVQTLLSFFHCLLAVLVGCETGRYINYISIGTIITLMSLHVLHIRKAGFNFKITDIMLYSSKVNTDKSQ